MSILQKMSVGYTLMVLPIVSLSPFNFIGGAIDIDWSILSLTLRTERSLDIALNILLYLPLGFGISTNLAARGFKASRTLALTLVASFLVSYSCEVLQSFLPARFPSWRDVGANMLGGILGSLGIFVSERKIVSFLLPSYVVAAVFVSLALQQEVTFRNWNDEFHLLVGNERTGDRPWQGNVSEFFIANRAATESDIQHIFAQRQLNAFLSNSLVAYYLKDDELKGYRDALNNSPPLIYKEDLNKRLYWFESAEPARRVTRDLAKTSQFTLGAIVNNEHSHQKGPARIISLSEDTGQRNFTMGQFGTDFVFRLRTPLTGENGANRYLVIPSVFATSKVRQIVVTFDGTTVLAYLDGIKTAHSLELSPVLAAYPFFNLADWPSVRVATVIYYGVIFVPFGMMLSLVIGKSSWHANLGKITWGTLIISFCSLGLETLLVLVSGRTVQTENVFLATSFSLASFLICFFSLNSAHARQLQKQIENPIKLNDCS